MQVINNTQANISASVVVQKATTFYGGEKKEVVGGVKALVFKPGKNDVDISADDLKGLEKIAVIKSLVSEGSLRIAESKPLELLFKKKEDQATERAKRFTKGLKEAEKANTGESKKVQALEAKIEKLESMIDDLTTKEGE